MYIAARGGEAAIQASEALYHRLKGPVTPELVRQIEDALPYLVDRVMGEGSLYAPELAALAIAQTGGDLYEAVLLLRAYRSTQPRLAYARPVTPDDMLTIRRISASFKDIPGGQILGPSLDYSHRLLRLDVLDEPGQVHPDDADPAPEDVSADRVDGMRADAAHSASPTGYYPLVAQWQRQNGLLAPAPPAPELHPADIPDVTRDPVMFPA
ncbi:MAG: carbon-phosphorus lyase complex subunit PhnI, partial [Anaerolinea sp.]|nr:carbon-phosphorus lyase complex subunit PhnI [Anaerolinea sp.]